MKRKKTIITALLCLFAPILVWIITGTTMYDWKVATAQAAETEFKGASGKSGDLTWKITEDGHLTIEGTGNYERTYSYTSYIKVPAWCEYNEYIKTAEIKVQGITSTAYMFCDCRNLTNLDLTSLNTGNVTDMSGMFYFCSSLTSLNLTPLNTSNVTDMSGMLYVCSSLTNLDLTSLNTGNVTDMSGMFSGCSSLTNLDLTSLNTGNVTDMSGMFESCSSLTSLDLTPLNTGNVTDMSWMFSDCSSLTNLNLTPLNTGNVTNMSGMFYVCSSLTSLDLTPLNTGNVGDMSWMFSDCSSLTSLNLTPLNTGNVTNMSVMFQKCSSLTSLDLTPLDTDNVTNMSYMFGGCSALTSLDLTPLDTGNVTDMEAMFSGCSALTSLDLTPLDTGNVTDMGAMFSGCSGLTSLDLTPLDTGNVTDMSWMFGVCCSLTNLDLTPLDTGNVTDMSVMFSGCSSLTSLDISNLDIRKLKYYYNLDFNGLDSLERLNFFADSPVEYILPCPEGYYWVNDNRETVTKTDKDVIRKVSYFRIRNGEPPVIPIPVPDDNINIGIYADSSCVSPASISARTLFVYGGNVKQADNSRINYNTRVYYTKLQASDIVTVNSKGKTITKKGKLVVGITSTSKKPSLVNGKISKDTSASKIAKASISKGKIKVTAQKEPGVVYLWVMDTGDSRAYACAKIVIKAAPSKLQVFAKPSSGPAFSADKKNLYKKDVIELGDSIKIYVYPTYKQNGQFKETKDASYSASINSAAASYFTVTQDTDNPCCFIVTANGLKNNKKTAGKITIKCNENGKKTVFTAYAVNGVQNISFNSVNGMAEDAGTVSGSAVVSYTIARSDTDKKTGSFVISASKKNDSFNTTDKVRIYAMGSENGFDKAMMEKGKVKITSKPSGSQKKLTAKLNKDKKTVTVTAAKKVPAGTTTYYLIMYNNKENAGYKVVKITTV